MEGGEYEREKGKVRQVGRHLTFKEKESISLRVVGLLHG